MVSAPSVALIVLAAGNGIRMEASHPKAFLALDGKSLLFHAINRGLEALHVSTLVVVVPPLHHDTARVILAEAAPKLQDSEMIVISGGKLRSDSVALALNVLSARPPEHVLVHDSARALAPSFLFRDIQKALITGADAAIPVLPVVDTLKRVDNEGRIVGTVDRETVRIAQTPQGFQRDVLERVHASGASTTDDAALVEQAGGSVVCVKGSPQAFKITTPFDLVVAEALLSSERESTSDMPVTDKDVP